MGRNSGGVAGIKSRGYSELAKDAIDYYVDGNGYDLNYNLRNGRAIEGEDALLRKGLDEATAKPLTKEYTIYRGTTFSSIFGEDAEYGKVRAAILDNDKSLSVMEAYNKAKQNAMRIKTDKGYMSGSLKASVAEGFGGERNVVMKITARKGTKGIDLSSNRSLYKNNTYESEVILTRGLKYKITKIYSKNNKIYVDATITK